jgi:putative tryptophan/tyrosine transport system substrate-binding protein
LPFNSRPIQRQREEADVRFRLGRRGFILSTGLVVAPFLPASAQVSLRIGWLSISPHPFVADFRERLRQLGYIEGENLVIEYRYAHGDDATLLPAMVDELIKAGVSILVTSGSAATDAALAAAKGVPIVFVTSDPTKLGQIESLARPGGVATGISLMFEEIGSKLIDLMRNAVPGLTRLAILQDDSPGAVRQADSMVGSARRVGTESRVFSLAKPELFSRMFAEVEAARWRAAFAVSSPLFAANARVLAGLAATHRLPAMFDNPSFVRAGALMSYGPDLPAAFRRQAELVVRVARGARLADIPIEQATKFILAFNRTAAASLGLPLSPLVMASVDELID